MTPYTMLIVTADEACGWDLGEQLDADGHDVYLAQTVPARRRSCPRTRPTS